MLWKTILALIKYSLEQGSSASYMTATKCFCQTYWVRWTSKRRSIRLCPSSNGGRPNTVETSWVWMCYHFTNGQRHGNMLKNQLFLWKWIYTHLVAGLQWDRQFEKVLLQTVWEKAPTWQCLVVHRQQGLFLPVYGLFFPYTWTTLKLQGRKRIWNPCWNKLIWGNRLRFLIKYTRVVLDANANRATVSWMSAAKCSSHEFPLEQLKSSLILQ